MLNVIILRVVMLNVIMLNILSPDIRLTFIEVEGSLMLTFFYELV
jgi:hypothetical protein